MPTRSLRIYWTLFPRGSGGLALLILRITAFGGVVAQALDWLNSSGGGMETWLAAPVALVCAVLLLAGLATPVAGFLIALGSIVAACAALLGSAQVRDGGFSALMIAGVAAAIVLLGPGKLSVDALLFGPREIVIPSGRP